MCNFLVLRLGQEQANNPSLITYNSIFFQDGTITSLSTNTNKPSPYDHVPCVACEAEQRPAHSMFVGMVDCPSKDMTLEYRGYLVSNAEQDDERNMKMTPKAHRGTYECLDGDAERLSASYIRVGGAGLVLVAAEAAHKTKALSCVVCTK